MKNFKFLLSTALIVSLFSCSSDDDNRTITPPSTQPQPTENTKLNELNGTITTNTTLKADTEYLITGPLTVKDGANLTIEAGTVVKAKSGRTDIFLAIERGAKLIAKGTATNPIVFTSDSSSPKAGDWGGIVIAGKAKSNKGIDVQSEVAGLLYGGTEDNDNSGELSYVIAEYTGAKINNNQEFNGISFFGVGSSTIINNIVIREGADDGIEFFGGSANVTNVFCSNIADDMFDWTGGYTGTITNAFGVRNDGFKLATDDPRGIEGDSNSSDATATPISTPTLKNITILNLDTVIPLNAGAEIRRGTVATIDNIVFATYGSASFGNRIDTENDKGNGTLTITNAVAQGNVGDDNIGGTITGTVTVVTDAISVPADNKVEAKTGVGADLTAFAWANPVFVVKK